MPTGAIVLHDGAFFIVHLRVCHKTADHASIFETNPQFTVMEKLTLAQRLEHLFECYQQETPYQYAKTHFAELLHEFAAYFQLSEEEAWFLCTCIYLHTEDQFITFKSLSVVLKETVIRIMTQENQIEHLKQKGFLSKQRSRRHRWSEEQGGVIYELTEWVMRTLMSNIPYQPKAEKPNDWFDRLYELFNLAKLREEEEFDTRSLMCVVDDILSTSADMPLFDYVNKLKLSNIDSYILLYCIASHLSGDEEVVLNHLLNQVFDNRAERVRIMQLMKGQHHELIRRNLIGFSPNSFMNHAQLVLTETVLNDLVALNISLEIKNTTLSSKLVRQPNDIIEKPLFYNEAERGHIQTLHQLLLPENYADLCRRLEEKQLSKGIVVLLYGEPGTGKTETVLQLAKQSGRGIMKVDISATKSAYFCESEKTIKQGFTQYQQAFSQLEKGPILLFNEADAIFTQRRNNTEHNLSQTENAMQNIVLDELENFKGILMATTNRATLMDSAYERRFLFKIKFNLPDKKTRAQIWQHVFPEINAADCYTLAERYAFSGAQIENIVRKMTIQHCLNPQAIEVVDIIFCCEAESIEGKTPSEIGFIQNRV
ncbi:MAG: ATP-binding protein [Chitinophagaceae bacterium]|nr:ATP-binding protein [Chitinophagaceae bacterium]